MLAKFSGSRFGDVPETTENEDEKAAKKPRSPRTEQITLKSPQQVGTFSATSSSATNLKNTSLQGHNLGHESNNLELQGGIMMPKGHLEPQSPRSEKNNPNKSLHVSTFSASSTSATENKNPLQIKRLVGQHFS